MAHCQVEEAVGVLDTAQTTATFGLSATPWDEVVAASVAAVPATA